MRALNVICAAGLMAGVAIPAFAAGTMTMMKKGETIAIMPDGAMGTIPSMDAMMMKDAMKHAKPLDHCVMMMMGEDGKMYMMDTKAGALMKECEKMAM